MEETLNRKDKIQFRIELVLALIITALACAASLSNNLTASNDFYPFTSDGMGHMTKVRFLAESLSRGEFPSWFPYWYNGATVTQYYPPLSYWIMTPIFMLTQNAMLTFKINCILVIFSGGMGIWYFCRQNIGRWCGLFGSVTYCLQPFILRALLSAGMLAQGPIIALLPWYLIVFLKFGKKPSALNFLLCTLLCALMILSHPNTIFMVCFLIMAIALVFVLLRRISVPCYLYMAFSSVFAGILTAFWSVVGVTGLENPTLPVMSPELPAIYTADQSWYFSLHSSWFHFAIPVSACSLLALFLYAYRKSKKKADSYEDYYIFFCILLTAFTILFTFETKLPFFRYLPMAQTFIPARTLVLASVTGAVLCAYLLFWIANLFGNKKVSVKVVAFLLSISVTGATIYFMNPLETKYSTIPENTFEKMLSNKSYAKIGNFEKGRYSYIGSYDSSESYFPIVGDFNITEGWNIEGTPHYETYRNFLIAIPTNNFDYIAKNLAFWNVRSVLINKDYNDIIDAMNRKYSFKVEGFRKKDKFYISDDPSTYYLTDRRNTLIMGAGSPGVTIEFPYLVGGRSNDITDYTLEELEKYEIIYLCEPAVETIQEKAKIEAIIEELLAKGTKVIIEPTIAKGYSLFDVVASDIDLENSPVIQKQPEARINSTVDNIAVDESMKYGRALFGLDNSYYKMIQNNGELENDIIGTKKVGSGEVIFIGNHLSQYLKAVYTRNFGVSENKNVSYFPECADDIKALFEDIFTTCGVNKDFWPGSFPVKRADWNYKGVDFEYSSSAAKEMTVSVTYSPRWRATLDGKEIPIGQREHLIILDLPAGDHEVKLVYGLTKYGIAGYIISLLGLLIFILFIKFYDIIMYHFRQVCTMTGKFLQIGYDEQQNIN